MRWINESRSSKPWSIVWRSVQYRWEYADQSAKTKPGTANHHRILNETYICLIAMLLSVLSQSLLPNF